MGRGGPPDPGLSARPSGLTPHDRTRDALVAALLLLLALLPRVVFWTEWNRAGLLTLPVVDAATFDLDARRLLLGVWPGPYAYWQAPLYTYFLAGIYSVFGASWVVARLVQALLGAATCLIVWRIARLRLQAPWALAAYAACVVCGPLIYFEGQLLRTTLATFLLTGWVWLQETALERRRLSWWLLSGCLLGVTSLAREQALVLVPVAAVFALGLPRRRAAAAACLVLGAAATLAPVTWHNVRSEGILIPVSTSGGLNLYLGNNPVSNETLAIRPGSRWEALLDQPRIAAGAVTEAQASRWFAGQAVRWAVSDPLAFLGNLGRKVLGFVTAHEIPRNQGIYDAREGSHLLQLLLWKSGPFGFPFGIIGPLALVGLVFGRGRRAGLEAAVILAYGAAVILIFPASRYRAPLLPLLTVAAATGAAIVAGLFPRGERSGTRRDGLEDRTTRSGSLADGTSTSFTETRDRRSIAVIAVLLVAAIAVDGGWVRARENPADSAYLRGNALLAAGRTAEAAEELQRSISHDPGNVDTWTTWAAALAISGRGDGSEQAARRALAIDSTDARAWTILGRLARERGDADAAEVLLRRAVDVRPFRAEPRLALADLCVSSGRTEEARSLLRNGLDLAPRSGSLWLFLGTLQGQAGSWAEAEQALRAAVHWMPESPDAWNALGLMHLQMGRREEAQRSFLRALRINPAHEPSRVNLRRFGLTSPES